MGASSSVPEDELRSFHHADAKTLYEGFQRGCKKSRDRPCMGFRRPTAEDDVDDKGKVVGKKMGPYEWLTYAQCQQQIDQIGSGILHENLYTPVEDMGKNMNLVAVYSKNRYEWVIIEQACNAYSGVIVPLYDTLGPDAASFILNQCGMRSIFCSVEETSKVINIKRSFAEACTALVNVIQYEDVNEALRKQAQEAGLKLYSFAELMEIGKAHQAPHTPPKAEDVATFCYTSGTTGNPKGAMLSHRNIIADVSAAIDAGIQTDETDVHISYLPLAHMFERVVQCIVFMHGGAIGFYQGNTLKLVDDIQALHPTLFPSVPRLFNRIYDRITSKVNAAGGLKASLFNKGLEAKRYWLMRNHLKYGFWDGLVFDKVKASLGLDRVKLLVTGSAPIAGHVMEFFRIVFGVPFVEGYGQTECAAAATVTNIRDQVTLGHVGGPLSCNEVKLVSVPEMGYNVTDTEHNKHPCVGRGEVCYRGPNVFVGYFRDPAKTAEAVDPEGWLHSGDIGLWDPEGHLRIIDRKKNIFKLAQGEYVAAEKIENIYQRASLVMQCFVYGDSLQSCLVGVIVPDAEQLTKWAVDNGMGEASVADLCKDIRVKKAIVAEMASVGKEGKLSGFEMVKDIHLHPEPFSVENDLLTPTFKLKRHVAKVAFQAQIDAMYAGLGETIGGKAGLKQGE